MKVFYLDPGLRFAEGHHPVHCRLIAGEFRARGIATRVLAHRNIDPKLRAELGAEPFFRHHIYEQSDGDPICGWLSGFDFFTRMAFEDLTRIGGIAPADLVYLSTVQPIELAALSAWMARHPSGAMPNAVAEFCLNPGVGIETSGTARKIVMPDPRREPRPLLYHYAAMRMLPHILPRLRLAVFEPETGALLRELLGRPVELLPIMFEAVTGRADRTGKRPITVGLLGHQQRYKGYHLAPEIVRALLRERPELRFLIHNADPEGRHTLDPTGLVEAQAAFRELSAQDRRVEVSEGPAGKDLWAQLLARTDAMLCPYAPGHYSATFSGVAVDAVANGIPVVGPAGTAIESLLKEFGGPGTLFEKHEPEAIAAATIELVDAFDGFAAIAHEAAAVWPTRYGPRAMVDALLAMINAAPAGARGPGAKATPRAASARGRPPSPRA